MNELLDKYSLHYCPVKSGCICDVSTNDSDKTNPYDWSWIDTVFCICLKNSDDRLTHSVEQFHKYGLCTRVLYYRPDPPRKEIMDKLGIKTRGSYGCWESHRQVAWLAKNLFNSKHNLVFEDDVLFLPHFTPKILKKIKYHIQHQLLPNSWDIYYLGHMPLYGNYLCGNNLWRVHSLLMHAYIQSSCFIDKVINMPWTEYGRIKRFGKKKEIALDGWAVYHARQYAYSPMIAVQGDLSTNNNITGLAKKHHENLLRFHARNTQLIEFVFMKFLIILLISLILFVIVFGLYKFTKEKTHHEKLFTNLQKENTL